jgi:hypothetical protein
LTTCPAHRNRFTNTETPCELDMKRVPPDLVKIILKMILDQIKIIFSKTILDQMKIIFLPQKSSFLRVKISILILEKPPKYRNHTRNHVKLTYLKNTQKIHCLKRPKFLEQNDLILLKRMGRNDLRSDQVQIIKKMIL